MNKKPNQFRFSKLPAIIGAEFLVVLLTFFAYRLISRERHKADLYDKNGQLRYLTFGEPPAQRYQNAEFIVASRYGFRYISVAGCVVNNTLIDTVHEHNELVENILQHKFGQNWRDKFNAEVDTEAKREELVKTLIERQPYIVKCNARLKKAYDFLEYDMKPISGSTAYHVDATGWGSLKGKETTLTYYKLMANYKTGEVKILADNTNKPGYK